MFTKDYEKIGLGRRPPVPDRLDKQKGTVLFQRPSLQVVAKERPLLEAFAAAGFFG
jgi:hypothetical protein